MTIVYAVVGGLNLASVLSCIIERKWAWAAVNLVVGVWCIAIANARYQEERA